MEVNGDGAKPHRLIREGDRIRIGRGFGRYQDVIVRIAIDQHVKKSEARALYDDVTPKPTPEEIEARRMRARVPGGRPGRRHTRSPPPQRDSPVQGDWMDESRVRIPPCLATRKSSVNGSCFTHSNRRGTAPPSTRCPRTSTSPPGRSDATSRRFRRRASRSTTSAMTTDTSSGVSTVRSSRGSTPASRCRSCARCT